jgi:L-lactate dehydrogenase complex protein LldG
VDRWWWAFVTHRQQILDRIRQALRGPQQAEAIPRDYHRAGAGGTIPVDLVALFEDRLLDYRAAVRRCAYDEIASTVASALAHRGAERMIAPDGVPSGWLPSALRDRPATSPELPDRLDGVLTTCAVAIAETGTIVLDHGPGQGRRALTLIPDYHLVVVHAEQIVRSVPDAIAALDPRRPMTWISGPSATSDIELSRVEGVHGPRRLEVVVASRPS